jgi:hypothetical protein
MGIYAPGNQSGDAVRLAANRKHELGGRRRDAMRKVRRQRSRFVLDNHGRTVCSQQALSARKVRAEDRLENGVLCR